MGNIVDKNEIFFNCINYFDLIVVKNSSDGIVENELPFINTFWLIIALKFNVEPSYKTN